MQTIKVRYNEYNEYEVPAPTADEIYYTDDLQDAIGTARTIHGCGSNDDSITVDVRRGTYTQEDA